ncbi:uncharacterized protein LOC100209737 isoform X2 [Hydra vulgaris]|uniref:Uncharacterized protein LOC100209737 isoform X2 n=1 Tax=Hydra vulgaris TaxID=6087 RepID=A0ABM4BQK5_HYDVU
MQIKFVFLSFFLINNGDLFRHKSKSTIKTQTEKRFPKNALSNNAQCGNKSRDCLENYIHKHLMHKEKHVNKYINRGLNISDEKKFIQEVLKNMLDDNADTFREVNEDDIRFSKYLINKHKEMAWLKKHGKFFQNHHSQYHKKDYSLKNALKKKMVQNRKDHILAQHRIVPTLFLSKKSSIVGPSKNVGNPKNKILITKKSREIEHSETGKRENHTELAISNNLTAQNLVQKVQKQFFNSDLAAHNSSFNNSEGKPFGLIDVLNKKEKNITILDIINVTSTRNYNKSSSNETKQIKVLQMKQPLEKITVLYAIGDHKSSIMHGSTLNQTFHSINIIKDITSNEEYDDDEYDDDDENHLNSSVERCKRGQVDQGYNLNTTCHNTIGNTTTHFLKDISLTNNNFSKNFLNSSFKELTVDNTVTENKNDSDMNNHDHNVALHFDSEVDALAEKRNKLLKKLKTKEKVHKKKKIFSANNITKPLKNIEDFQKDLPQNLLNIDEQIIALESGWDLEFGSNSTKDDEKSEDESGENESIFYSKDFYKEFDQVVQNNTDEIKDDIQNNGEPRNLPNKKNKKKLLHNSLKRNSSEEKELTVQSYKLNQIDINRKSLQKKKKKSSNKESKKSFESLDSVKNLQVNWNEYVKGTQQSVDNQLVKNYENFKNQNPQSSSLLMSQKNSHPEEIYHPISAVNYLPYRFQEPVISFGVTSYPTPTYEYPTVSYSPSISTSKKIPPWAMAVPEGKIKASRVCKPGPMKPAVGGKPNCLIIGDSIALGYSYSVATALKNLCQVQLTPSSKAGVALDSAYGLQCLDMFLATSDLIPTYYDVIIFNFGLHDIDYLEKYPEEHSNIDHYTQNIRKIKEKLLATGATLAFALSTPVTFNKKKDDLIKMYNHAAKLVMQEKPYVLTVNLHKLVTKHCGHAPFENCFMMKKPHDVHYGVTGAIILGKRIAFAIKYLLDKRKISNRGKMPVPKQIVDLSVNATTCPILGDQCPAHTTCTSNIVSRSGSACCPLMYAVDCEDSWHCCPRGTICHPGCSDLKCSCIK